MKLELTLPPELFDHIVAELFEKIKPLYTLSKSVAAREDDVIYDVAGLSEYLKVSKKWVYEQTHLKAIPHLKLGNKQLRFRKKEIDTWLGSLRVPSVNTPSVSPENPLLFNELKTRMG